MYKFIDNIKYNGHSYQCYPINKEKQVLPCFLPLCMYYLSIMYLSTL